MNVLRPEANEMNLYKDFLNEKVCSKLDTQEESFQAYVAIEARWILKTEINEDEILSSLSNIEQNRLEHGETIKLSKDFSETYWHPQLFLLNIAHNQYEIREYRDVHGIFDSKFDLHYFPTDVQQLSISMGSALFDNQVSLIADPNQISGINRETFVDQQEWKLYDHIKTRTKFLRGFLFQNDDENELDRPGHKRKRSVLIVACYADIIILLPKRIQKSFI
ncbi:hypothetical protein I4U23_010442 [Adineta vaga]|nr:hypothetical protein I4U23_010442 [Adineta vaga]